jgi:hypothetical protein
MIYKPMLSAVLLRRGPYKSRVSGILSFPKWNMMCKALIFEDDAGNDRAGYFDGYFSLLVLFGNSHTGGLVFSEFRHSHEDVLFR